MNALKNAGILHNNIKRALFDNFILKPGHEHLLQHYLIACTVHSFNIDHVINAFHFHLNNGLSFSQLFRLDPLWADFFKENTFPSGQSKDNRFGVDQHFAFAIQYIKNTHGCNLDDAIQLFLSNGTI